MNQRAVVFGATGHIGAHVVRALLARGYAVRATYRNPRYRLLLEDLPVEAVPVDLDEPSRVASVVDGCPFVFYCAGYYPRWTDHRLQAIARGLAQVRRVFDVLRSHPAQRIVYTSSASTIAPRPGRASTEADGESWPLAHWRPLYATVKTAMEHEVLRYAQAGLPVVIVNPSVCIGEYDAHAFSGRLVLLFARGTVPVYLEHHLNAIYTGDVGVGHVVAAERGQVGARYLLAAHNVSLLDFARLVAEEAGVRPPRWRVPYPLARTAAVATELIAAATRTEPLLSRGVLEAARIGQRLDAASARRDLDLPQTPLDEAIRRAVGWFRQHRYL